MTVIALAVSTVHHGRTIRLAQTTLSVKPIAILALQAKLLSGVCGFAIQDCGSFHAAYQFAIALGPRIPIVALQAIEIISAAHITIVFTMAALAIICWQARTRDK